MTNNKIEEGEHTDRINLHLSARMKRKLVAMAELRSISINEVVRLCIKHSDIYFEDPQ